ncbi:MAG TPA: hypothetical protein VEC06_05630 [Paucimonas sp.]|nr:hypothetical protein [Paucimonas sp.]
MPSVADALAGARFQALAQAKRPTVLIAGADSRLGERVLARVLGSGEYSRIHVLAADAMRSTESRLLALTLDEWTERVDHVIAVIDDRDPGFSQSMPRKRTEIFSSLATDDVPQLARRAEALGVARFMLVTPTDPWSRPAALYAQLGNVMESELTRLRFEALMLVRPSHHGMRQRRGHLAQRILGMLVDTMRGMMVGKHPPMTLDHTAQVVVRAMFESRAGLTILESERLHELLKS